MVMKNLLFSLTLTVFSLVANCQNSDNVEAMIDGYKSKDTIKIADFLKLSELSLNNKDYWIVSFTMLYTDGTYDIELGSSSNKITDAMKRALLNLKDRDTKIHSLIFKDINVQKAQTKKIEISNLICRLKIQ